MAEKSVPHKRSNAKALMQAKKLKSLNGKVLMQVKKGKGLKHLRFNALALTKVILPIFARRNFATSRRGFPARFSANSADWQQNWTILIR